MERDYPALLVHPRQKVKAADIASRTFLLFQRDICMYISMCGIPTSCKALKVNWNACDKAQRIGFMERRNEKGIVVCFLYRLPRLDRLLGVWRLIHQLHFVRVFQAKVLAIAESCRILKLMNLRHRRAEGISAFTASPAPFIALAFFTTKSKLVKERRTVLHSVRLCPTNVAADDWARVGYK